MEAISDKDIRLMKKMKIPFVKTVLETDSTEFLFHNGNGMPHFKQILPNNPELRASRYDAGAFEIYDEKGEKFFVTPNGWSKDIGKNPKPVKMNT